MALDLSGIVNVGEFFSQHYLEQLLDHDLKDLLKGWADADNAGGPKAPPKRLAALANPYFKQAWQAMEDPDPRRRLTCAQTFHGELLTVLGYERHASALVLGDGELVPLVAALDHDRRPWLWIVEAPFAEREDDAKPFDESILPEQLPLAPGSSEAANDGAGTPPRPTTLTWRELLDGPLFRSDEPARWVLFLAGADAFLIDRYKWPQGKYLHFQLGPLLGKRQTQALQAVAALLHREALMPDGGTSLLDRLDEASHKHAFAVSTDLKWGVERSIERIGNEAIHYCRTVSKNGLYQGKVTAEELTRECITYMYRLLFLFYVEARGSELGVVPMKSDAYRLGYSLEALRDLELVALTTPDSQNGYYLHESLERLFDLVQKGHAAGATAATGGAVDDDDDPIQGTFGLSGLGSPLFDRTRTPILSAVKLRNHVLQEILQNLSLSREARGKERGRISYAQLGINQLGAVYERLLSFSGFFAQEKLYEVRAKTEVKDDDARTYFVPERKIGDYHDDEKVRNESGRPVTHEKGAYLFKLAGRDREKNASYYTPEVLTECLTKYTLKVRLGEPLMKGEPTERAPISADEMLELTLCEPAMGSGAFLNEAVNQLAHKYLEKKQQELGKNIPADEYQREWTKVKYHYVAHQVYGVDLNPLAAELGKISLWLNALVPEAPPLFLDPRIGVGNSLLGARREVFLAESLTAKHKGSAAVSWLSTAPVRVPLGPGGFQPRPEGSVYHFLLPVEGMVAYADDKVVKQLEPERAKALREWRKELCKPLNTAELTKLSELSDCIDSLWQRHIDDRMTLLRQVRQPVPLWGRPHTHEAPESRDLKTAADCEALNQRLTAPTAAGQRLKGLMDYSCALWFWPLLESGTAPTRTQWLGDADVILRSGVPLPLHGPKDAAAERWRVVNNVIHRRRFFHWEVQFAEVFAKRGGLDVLLGNPPWLKLEWQEAGILGDLDPTINLRGLGAAQTIQRRRQVLAADSSSLISYLSELEEAQGIGGYLNAIQNYPLLKGIQTNLYKCFICLATGRRSTEGVVGLLHQSGLFDDPRGGRLRAHIYPQLRLVAAFQNQLKLFAEVAHPSFYSFSVLDGRPGRQFLSFSSGFHPSTFVESANHDGGGTIPGLRTPDGKWELRGHRSRVVRIDEESLRLFALLYDSANTPFAQARLPVVHSQEILEVLRRFAKAGRRLEDLTGEYFSTEHFHETNQQSDGTIRHETRFPAAADQWVLSGPHFYVGAPFNKTPNDQCRSKGDYTSLDLTQMSDDYLPRTNFVPACSPAVYRDRTPQWHGKPVTEFYRQAFRAMLPPTNERTLIGAIIPPGPAHIHGVVTYMFADLRKLLLYHALSSSLPYDFFARTTGKQNLSEVAKYLPLPETMSRFAEHRALRLNCLTTHYAELWRKSVTTDIGRDMFSKVDRRLGAWSTLSLSWSRHSALRTPFERRQALVELDALAAISLGISLDQLLLLYRVQFPILQQYERETFYDQRGKIAFTVNRGLSSVGLVRQEFDQIRSAPAGTKLPAFAHDAGGPFIPPFDRCDREEDMAQAYAHFKALLAQNDDRGPGIKKPSHPPPPERRRAGNGG